MPSSPCHICHDLPQINFPYDSSTINCHQLSDAVCDHITDPYNTDANDAVQKQVIFGFGILKRPSEGNFDAPPGEHLPNVLKIHRRRSIHFCLPLPRPSLWQV